MFVLHFDNMADGDVIAADTPLQSGGPYNPVLRHGEGVIRQDQDGHKGLYLNRDAEIYIPSHSLFTSNTLYIEMVVCLRAKTGAFFFLNDAVSLVSGSDKVYVHMGNDASSYVKTAKVGTFLTMTGAQYFMLELTDSSTGRVFANAQSPASFSWTPVVSDDRHIRIGGSIGDEDVGDMILLYLKVANQGPDEADIPEPSHLCK